MVFNYSDNFIHFFTYPKRNIHFLRFEDEILVLDCGASPNVSEFDGLDGVDIEKFLAKKVIAGNDKSHIYITCTL